MVLDLRSKYVLSFLLLVLIAIVTANIYLEYSLGEWLENQLVTELRRHAQIGRVLAESRELSTIEHNPDRLAGLFGQDPGIRITYIGDDGKVLGDSHRNGAALRSMDNHGQRPEVVAALQDGLGISRRESATMEQGMLYVALPFHSPDGGGQGVVRAALPLEGVQALTSRLRLSIIVAGLIAIMTAISLSGLFAHWTTYSQRHVIACAQTMAHSSRAPRIEIHANDALAGLASSLNLLAEEKNETLALLAERQSQMLAVLQSMHEGVIALDGRLQITLMNRSVMELLHLSQAPVGEAVQNIVPLRMCAELGLDRHYLPSQPFSTEFALDGPVERRVTAVVTPLHEHSGHVIVLRDVTEKRRLDAMRRDFVANVSHELRTPVSVLQANAQTLLEGALEDKKYSRILVSAMERNASRLAKLIADLLDLSRLEADQFAMEVQSLELLPIVLDVVDLVRVTAQEKEIELQVEVEAEMSILADAEVLRRILINFLDNAVKYIPNHSHVVVRTREQHGQWRLEVVDDGPGIAPQHRDRVFERFYRVDSGRSRKMGGTGLGLSIVKHLAEKMGEAVGMEAIVPQGSLFWLSLSRVIV
ncbi:ATP-binding protein [Candidatus Magnetaquicoccus inordinatus]|uniref:ATP-binding protein n=1 Tax=Candidatus Magnetaquicoccus inordinatus TaxID=2496818 RepID=UPI00102C9F84|nr:ATP-binding protein [Candidatus Magnetaquicoccus inordinatus]